MLARSYHVPNAAIGLYILPLVAGNFFGPILLGHLFDTVGRRRMVTVTYGVAGVLLAAVAVLYGMQVFTAWTQTYA